MFQMMVVFWDFLPYRVHFLFRKRKVSASSSGRPYWFRWTLT